MEPIWLSAATLVAVQRIPALAWHGELGGRAEAPDLLAALEADVDRGRVRLGASGAPALEALARARRAEVRVAAHGEIRKCCMIDLL